MTFKDRLNNNEFTYTAEVIPPKGTDVSSMLEKSKSMKGLVSAVNVTDMQRGVMRLTSVSACSVLEKNGIEAILQMTMRDKNRIAMQAELLSTKIFDIKNVLLITGDLPKFGDHKSAKSVYDLDVSSMIEVAEGLNNGKDMMGNKLKGNTDLFIGGACNPGYDPIGLQILMMEKKINAGAKFFQSQAVYDIKEYDSFNKRVKHLNTPILVGILPLKSVKMANFLNKKVPGVNVPQHFIEILEKSSNELETGIDIAVNLIKELKEMSSGIHIMAIGIEEKVADIINKVEK